MVGRDCPGPGAATPPAVRVHSSLTLIAQDIATVDGIPCTSVARTLVDLGDHELPRLVERAVDKAEVLCVFDLSAVADVLERAGPKRGPGVLQRPGQARPAGDDRPRARGALPGARPRRRADRPGGETPGVVTDTVSYKADFLWRTKRLVAEADSRAFHSSRKAFEHDRLRDQHPTLAGFTVVRFTWRQVTREPLAVTATLVALIGRKGPVARLAHP